MGVTKFDELNAPQSRTYVGANLPTSPATFYGSANNDVDSRTWKGGELAYLSTDTRIYIQTATSGTTATWKRLLDKTTAA